MRIIAWNCQMALRKKAGHILKYRPDILVVPECECPARLQAEKWPLPPTDSVWYGDNPHKGIGVFAFGDFRFAPDENYNDAYKWIVPLHVTGSHRFMLYAIWATGNAKACLSYIGQVYGALQRYQGLLDTDDCLLAGDFNSNKIWDSRRPGANHSTVVELLRQKGIVSAYHSYYREAQGEESRPTFFEYRHADKRYHLDYCFAPQRWIDRLDKVEIGAEEEYLEHSDHLPLIVDFA